LSVRLKVEHGQDAGRTWRLSKPGVYLVGRHPDNAIRVLDMKVSKEHCELILANGNDTRLRLKDLGSTHGCLVNGQPVKGERDLDPGDELRLGLTILRVLSNGEATDEAVPTAGRVLSGVTPVPGGNGGTDTKRTLAADELVGKELGGYKIERKIGQGGMGGVYLAEQVSLRRKVALKVLSPKFAADSAFVDQFLNEARAAGQLNHPNVVQVYDVGNADGRYFFSMEVMPGGSIEDRLREGPVEWPQALNHFIDASNALIFAQKRGILHRDVKPDNLMLSEGNDAKLCDLGLAKRSEVSDLIDQGIIGTPHFISPEAIRRRPDIDIRSDLYSLGCTFFRVLTRHNPYPGQNVKEILLGHLNKPVPKVTEHAKEVPAELSGVVEKLMQKDAAERFQTPDDLLRALDKIRTQYHLEAHGIKPASRKLMAAIALGALLVVGGAIAYVATRKDKVVVDPEVERQAAEVRLKQERFDAERRLSEVARQADAEAQTLKDRQIEPPLLGPKTWKLERWAQLAGDMNDKADALAKQVGVWDEEVAQVEDEVVRGFYANEKERLERIEQDLRDRAKDITEKVDKFRRNENEMKAAYDQAKAAVEQNIQKHVQELQQALVEQRYAAVEELLAIEKLEDLYKEPLARQVEGEPVLDMKEDVLPLLDKHLPLADPKNLHSRGGRIIEQALQLLEGSANSALSQATQTLGEKPGAEEFQRAIELLDGWIASHPEPAADVAERAPRVSSATVRLRTQAKEARDGLKKRLEETVLKVLARDRLLYYDLVRKIRAPRYLDGRDGLGFFANFRFQLARDAALQADRGIESPEFKVLTEALVADTQAFSALFDHARASRDSWANDKVELDDERGRTKKGRIKTVSAAGMQLDPSSLMDKEELPWADAGPAWLLRHFFFNPPESSGEPGTPRFEFGAQDLHGLAILAEMAGAFDDAERFWKRALDAYGEDPAAAHARRRLAALPAERETGTKWLAALRMVAEVEAFLAAHDPICIGEAFYEKKEIREAAAAEGLALRKKLQDVVTLRIEILDLPNLAGTLWGTSVRGEIPPHPMVSYAQVPLPEGGWK
jgi:pSer/pThr/pTyr-binding forkhead associated (FHA) protein